MDRREFTMSARARRTLPSASAMLGCLCFVTLVSAPFGSSQQSALAYLPDDSSLDGWDTLGDPQTAEGDDLFLLINGGAEIYNEYGFSRAVIHSYTKGDISVNLEVYEMQDAASAYGVYSFKTGRDGEPIHIGSKAAFEDYYLNFWKGNLVVTVIGFDTDSQTREAILELARMVEAKISSEGARPAIIDLLPDTSANGRPVHATYVEGNLGLLNRYRFANEDVFELTSAAVGDYGDHMLFLFPYESEEAAKTRLNVASQRLSASGLYSNAAIHEHGFSAEDRNGRFVSLGTTRQFLIAFVGQNGECASAALQGIVAKIVRAPDGETNPESLSSRIRGPFPPTDL